MATLLLDNYTNLQDAIGKELDRTDLADSIPMFITLAEAEIDRVLRRTVSRQTITINSETTSLSSTIAELRSIRLVTGSAGRDVSLDVVTPEMLSDIRARHGAVAGRPVAVAIIAGQVVVAPAPDTAYTAEIVAYLGLTKLSATVATNVILTEAPDLYFYGALTHSAAFLHHDERIETWRTFFQNALDQLHQRREREEHGANFRPMRLPYTFGERP
jgi:hypothetical protein